MAVQVEDYISATDTIAMSSVPVQFLVNIVEAIPENVTAPAFVGDIPGDGTCITIPVGSTFNLRLTARSGGDDIT